LYRQVLRHLRSNCSCWRRCKSPRCQFQHSGQT
jgi:hypothetical protein